ncbi:GNAT family protein, partial [Acinetobacter baumannii]
VALNHAFNKLGLEKVFGQVLSFNDKSLNFHRKMGFVQEGLLRKHFKDQRGEFDIYQFGLLRTEWLEDK